MARPRSNSPKNASFPVIAPLARGLDILRAYRSGDAALQNHEISRRTGIPPSSVSRLTGSLVALGYLSYDPAAQGYRLTPVVLTLSYAFLGGIPLRYRIRPSMQALADEARASVSLGARHQHNMIYLECCKGPSPVPFRFDVGSWLPLCRSAMGWAYLAGLDEADFAGAMDEIKLADEAAWQIARQKIERAREEVATHGFCVSIGEFESGVHTVGVPVRSRPGEPLYALNCGAPAYQLKAEQLVGEIGPRLVWLARSVVQDATPSSAPAASCAI
ncbi:IclR family transcriptional regulator [Rhodovastum sp. RN2-1]|uniref:IclR family transcriptional regulator n=2 Tax=Limobrevibacterium gyesilva TaxID=2991712 RepID=A0AA42CDJ7_9PROT|nr:IclR family transcriptional regulator [Limobrevibacterium gyesilva]